MEQIIIVEDINKYLKRNFPEFEIEFDDIDLLYIIAGAFSRYLLLCYKEKKILELQKGLDFIELLHLNGNSQVKEIAIIGYLEAIQNVFLNSGINPESIFNILGKESKKWWNQLNKFWNKEIDIVGQTIDKE